MNTKYFIYLKLLLVLSLSSSIFSCNTQKSNDPEESEQQTEIIDHEKKQVQSFWENYRKAQKNRVETKWEEAIKYYSMALEINNNHDDAWFNLGNMYLELNKYKKAEECWKRMVYLNPNSARAHMQLGRLYLSYERPEVFDIKKAKAEFLKTSSINKIVTGPLMLLGHVALIEGKIETAENYFLSVIGSDTKNVEAHFLLGYLAWKKGDIRKMKDYSTKTMNFSKPEKAVKGVLSEGDTKDGTSHLRPINESLFYDYFNGLDKIKIENKSDQIATKYKMVDLKIIEVNEKF